MGDVVRFEELSTSDGRRFGLATLDTPESLNALSLEMVRALTPRLRQWEQDSAIVGVLLRGAGDKAFCAGGDLRALYQSLRESAGVSDYARGFFAEEYELDHLIHTYAKPFICWGHGIVMGGGMGLMAGASHRVVTARSRLAMPEISVGLYPDVGGSWVLGRIPGHLGLFLALTGAPLNAADALFCGLADHYVGAQDDTALLAALRAASWSGAPEDHRHTLSRLLSALSSRELPESNVRRHFDLLRELMAGGSLLEIASRLRGLRTEDPWLSTAVATFQRGSPTSAALSFELARRARHLSLAEVFRLEYTVSLGCCAHPDFVEGIRALLISKDRTPRWTPDSLEAVSKDLVEDHFQPRFTGRHPLASLERSTP
ncbi:enoyl-CoA hydratase/isomerase family protein [Myxococcus sp. K15C18031901]|uniref:enoyl-CoA hydratase/isomerase family protein n=1 Tax=Myxococcus dinghuensis TaxID=2906761 RepID=UPI0020A7A513|nr:enoyl-CoA hydratase/isomerase family protein [Myxococcus dinghuensis]MCP3099432.1 enoyl-CoA hydratase/isomerase family protein [Myxococcus dinghuensis]